MGLESAIRIVDEDSEGVDRAFRADVLAGLSQRQKAIPARWFYDERGSELFEEITRLPVYYPTRAETAILSARGEDIAILTGPGRVVVEFGSGSSTKTPHLLSAVSPSAYVPIDISGEFLRQSAGQLAGQFAVLPILPVEADFTRPVPLPAQVQGKPMLGFFPGSTIGNLVPSSAVDLLRSMRQTLGQDAQLVIGMDRIKDEKVLVAAYDDPQGVTAAFNLNLVTRINRELGADIPAELLRHCAVWNDRLARIEMHLKAREDFAFTVCSRQFAMRKGETIHTENSHKYDVRAASLLLLAGGWTPMAEWRDSAGQFSVILAEASEDRAAP